MGRTVHRGGTHMRVSLAQGVLVVSALVLAQLFTARADGGAIPGRVLGGARHVLLSTRSRGGSRGGMYRVAHAAAEHAWCGRRGHAAVRGGRLCRARRPIGEENGEGRSHQSFWRWI